MNLEHAIEALLFWKGEAMSFKEIVKSLNLASASLGRHDLNGVANTTDDKQQHIKDAAVHEALGALVENLKGRGIVLMANEDEEYMLGTSTDASQLIEQLTREELNKDLGKASLEILSIILYQNPIKRSQIDYIRGVNSTFILRNLLIRGLIEKKPAPDDNRTSIYTPSFKLLSHLGVSKVSELPNFELVKEEIEKFKNNPDNEQESARENDKSADNDNADKE